MKVMYYGFLTFLFFAARLVQANEVDVLNVELTSLGGNRYQISVTVEHADTGWDHYANQWQVFDQDGNLLGTRILHHPHENEQPFTRSLSLEIPDHVTQITVEAADSVHETGGKTMTVEVMRP